MANVALGSNDAWCPWIGFQGAPQSQDLHVSAAVEEILEGRRPTRSREAVLLMSILTRGMTAPSWVRTIRT
jgi:hypothetical protein